MDEKVGGNYIIIFSKGIMVETSIGICGSNPTEIETGNIIYAV